MPKNKTELPTPDLHGAIRKMPARVKYLVNIYEDKTLIDHHELENPVMQIAKGDEITLWTNDLKELTVTSVRHRLDRSEWHWLVQTIDIYCIKRAS